MRVVLDTNTAVSGLLWGGAPQAVIRLAQGAAVQLYASEPLLDELSDVLQRQKFVRRLQLAQTTWQELVAAYRHYVAVVTPATLSTPVSVDPDDDAVLACAVAAHAEAIVSGDHHLLDLTTYQQISILTASELLQRVSPPASPM